MLNLPTVMYLQYTCWMWFVNNEKKNYVAHDFVQIKEIDFSAHFKFLLLLPRTIFNFFLYSSEHGKLPFGLKMLCDEKPTIQPYNNLIPIYLLIVYGFMKLFLVFLFISSVKY